MFDKTNAPNHLPIEVVEAHEAIVSKEHSSHEHQRVSKVVPPSPVLSRKAVQFLGREFPSEKSEKAR